MNTQAELASSASAARLNGTTGHLVHAIPPIRLLRARLILCLKFHNYDRYRRQPTDRPSSVHPNGYDEAGQSCEGAAKNRGETSSVVSLPGPAPRTDAVDVTATAAAADLYVSSAIKYVCDRFRIRPYICPCANTRTKSSQILVGS